MSQEIHDPRRAPRISTRCRVVVREGDRYWSARTEDVGPRGCQLITPRSTPIGKVLSLSISSALIDRALEVLGQVVWAHSAGDARAGISFSDAPAPEPELLTPAAWFRRLAEADPTMASRLRTAPRSLPADAVVYLAAPPPSPPALAPEELQVLRMIGAGMKVGDLQRLFAEVDLERVLFSLLSRRLATLLRASAAHPVMWMDVLQPKPVGPAAPVAVAAAAARRGVTPPPNCPGPCPMCPATLDQGAPPPECRGPNGECREPGALARRRRCPEAQRLYERGVELLVVGDALSAEALFRRATELAPTDRVLQTVLRQFPAR